MHMRENTYIHVYKQGLLFIYNEEASMNAWFVVIVERTMNSNNGMVEFIRNVCRNPTPPEDLHCE